MVTQIVLLKFIFGKYISKPLWPFEINPSSYEIIFRLSKIFARYLRMYNDGVLGENLLYADLTTMRKILRKLKIRHDKKRLENINYILYSRYTG